MSISQILRELDPARATGDAIAPEYFANVRRDSVVMLMLERQQVQDDDDLDDEALLEAFNRIDDRVIDMTAQGTPGLRLQIALLNDLVAGSYDWPDNRDVKLAVQIIARRFLERAELADSMCDDEAAATWRELLDRAARMLERLE